MARPAWRKLEVLDWGRLAYEQALDRQLSLVQERIADRPPDRLILVEHPPVITLGRSSRRSDLRRSPEALKQAGLNLHWVDRGGRATYHGPGQLVVYPIVKLWRKDLHWFLDHLLEAAAGVLRAYGLNPELKPDRPGLWVRGKKIASLGLAARSWVTYHGLALNVNTDLTGFEHIVPCGRAEETVASMAGTLGRPVDMEDVKRLFIRAFAGRFGYQAWGGTLRHPPWLIRTAPDQAAIKQMEERLDRLCLATVCQSARCPNLGECFSKGTATFMILGRHCTRGCRFCAVDKEAPEALDPEEPLRVAQAVRTMGLRHLVVTSVTRDDLPDGGAGQFARTIRQVRQLCPGVSVEVLVPDFQGSVAALDEVLAARPEVFNHNLETVARLYSLIRPQARYIRSLEVIKYAAGHGRPVKSGIMLGLGETAEEIRQTLIDLKRAGCTCLTLGQYLAPSAAHAPVARYVPPTEFDDWAEEARAVGFLEVASGPLVRSSYRAEDMYFSTLAQNKRRNRGQEKIHSGTRDRH